MHECTQSQLNKRSDAFFASLHPFFAESPRVCQGLTFKEDIGPLYPGPILGDKVRVRQVLSNALANAIKFTEVGEIVLRVQQTAESQDDIDIVIEICDTGCGVDEATLPTLFQPFKCVLSRFDHSAL